MLGTTTKLSMLFPSSRVVFSLERNILGSDLTVTAINIQKQEHKIIRNVKRSSDDMPKSMQTR